MGRMKLHKKKYVRVFMPILAGVLISLTVEVPVMAAEPVLAEMGVESEIMEIPMPETEVTSGSCGTNVNWSYDSEAKKLTISGTGAMNNYSSGSIPWYNEIANIESVVVEAGVTRIGNCAFYKCSSLSSIKLPSTVTSIGNYAFYSCEKLSSIEIPHGVTTIAGNTFQYCYELSSITIPDSVTSIGGFAFFSCGKLSSITIPSGVTSIGSKAFFGCKSINSITIPNGVSRIYKETFKDCSGLSSITIPDSVTVIDGYAFACCRNLSSVTIPDSVTSVGEWCFSSCEKLSSVVISNSLTKIERYTFYGCKSLENIDIPDSVTSIAEAAFSSCSKLSNVELPANITSIDMYAFSYCSSLKRIELPATITSIGADAFNKCSKLEVAVAACSWKSTPLYDFDTTVSKGYNHTGSITVQADDVQDEIIIHCDACVDNPDKTALTLPADLTYKGSPIEATAETNNCLFLPVVTHSGVNLTGGKPVNAGTYTATMTLDTPQGVKTVSLEYEIEKAASACTTVPAANSLTYTGQAQELVTVGEASGGTVQYSLSQDGSYGTAIPTGTDAGSYMVYYKVVGDGNHTDTATDSVNVTIDKAAGMISGENTYTKAYGDEAFEAVAANHSESELQYEILTGDDVISISGNNVSILKAGEATVKVILPETTNYNAAEKIITVTVHKKAGYTTDVINKSYLYLRENADSINLEQMLPADCGMVSYGEPQTEGDVTYSVAPVIENGILNYTVNAGAVDAQGIVEVSVSTDNYEDFVITVNVKLHNQKPVYVKEGMEVTLKKNILTVGEALSVLEFNPTTFVDEEGNTIEGTLAWKTPQTLPTLETQSATWIFTPENVEYATLEGMTAIVVEQFENAPNMPQDTMSVPYNIRKVSEVTLPGNWAWLTGDGDKVLKTEVPLTVIAEYIGADKYKYKNVTVQITVTREAKEWIFMDVTVKPGHWKYENVKYVYNNDIMNGIKGTTQFQPDESLNRAMFATVLYRIAGSPQTSYEAVFPDVEEGRYYSEAIVWAKQQGMVTGYGDGTYGVNRNITREQIAKILYEYAAGCGYDVSGKASLTSFTDGDEVSDWAEGYIRWAVHTGMIEGKPNDDGSYRIDPKGDATRAECAKMLRYFMETYNK